MQIYDKVTSANKVIMTQEANLFGTIYLFHYAAEQYIFSACSTPATRGYAVGNPMARRDTTFIFTVIVDWCGKKSAKSNK